MRPHPEGDPARAAHAAAGRAAPPQDEAVPAFAGNAFQVGADAQLAQLALGEDSQRLSIRASTVRPARFQSWACSESAERRGVLPQHRERKEPSAPARLKDAARRSRGRPERAGP